jgi:hypothetical protein
VCVPLTAAAYVCINGHEQGVELAKNGGGDGGASLLQYVETTFDAQFNTGRPQRTRKASAASAAAASSS